MARPNRPVTINDLRSSGQSHHSSNAGRRSNDENHKKNAALLKQPTTKQYTANPSLDPKILHIPSLPLEKECRNMLERVVREFLPIIQRRGYNVASISELCCCGDGLDSMGGRKRRKMAHNILGYNQTTSFGGKHNKRHTIHLRLRHPSSHNDRLYCYEEVAGTLAHELAHCEHSPHNDSFFKLMDDILDEHATLMASGVVGTGDNGAMALPAFSGTGHVLGGTSGTATANDVQQARLQAVGGTKLGGDNRFAQWMTPREAAVAAAMLRSRQQQLRLRGNRCCQPCNLVVSNESDSSDSSDNEVEILETDPELAKQNPVVRTQQPPRKAQQQQPKRALSTLRTANEKEANQDSKPRAVKPSKKGKTNNDKPNIIDLTGSDSDEEDPVAATAAVALDAPGADRPWPCRFCTYANNPARTVCEVCNHPQYEG